MANDKAQIRRRHSITLCESRHRKSSTESNVSTTASTTSNDQRSSPKAEQGGTCQQFASLNVTAIEQNDFQEVAAAPKTLKTLDLRLEEVAHIRSVLTKAELEAMQIDGSVRDSIERGKVA